MSKDDWIHRVLDGDVPPSQIPSPGSREDERLVEYQRALDLLAEGVEAAPDDLLDRVLGALPPEPDGSWLDRLRGLWPHGIRWLAPALAGALATLFVAVLVGRPGVSPPSNRVAVTFEVRAPGAGEVDLVGSFNGWRPGEIVLQGPDAAGYWTTTIQLPAGRHEYLFLVDGRQWLTDPRAAAHRPDGFGHTNALIEL